SRHDHEEDHDQAMRREEYVVGVGVGEDLQPRVLKLHAHGDGEDRSDDAGRERQHQVHGPDVLVVRGVEKSPPADRLRVRGPGHGGFCGTIVGMWGGYGTRHTVTRTSGWMREQPGHTPALLMRWRGRVGVEGSSRRIQARLCPMSRERLTLLSFPWSSSF